MEEADCNIFELIPVHDDNHVSGDATVHIQDDLPSEHKVSRERQRGRGNSEVRSAIANELWEQGYRRRRPRFDRYHRRNPHQFIFPVRSTYERPSWRLCETFSIIARDRHLSSSVVAFRSVSLALVRESIRVMSARPCGSAASHSDQVASEISAQRITSLSWAVGWKPLVRLSNPWMVISRPADLQRLSTGVVLFVSSSSWT